MEIVRSEVEPGGAVPRILPTGGHSRSWRIGIAYRQVAATTSRSMGLAALLICMHMRHRTKKGVEDRLVSTSWVSAVSHADHSQCNEHTDRRARTPPKQRPPIVPTIRARLQFHQLHWKLLLLNWSVEPTGLNLSPTAIKILKWLPLQVLS